MSQSPPLDHLERKTLDWLAERLTGGCGIVWAEEIEAHFARIGAEEHRTRVSAVLKALEAIETYEWPPMPKFLVDHFAKGTNPPILQGSKEDIGYRNWLMQRKRGWKIDGRVFLIQRALPNVPTGGSGYPTPTVTQPGEGAGKGKKGGRAPLAEAEILVRDWLAKHAKANPATVTRDAVVAATGVSAGTVSKTAAWKAFSTRRAADKKPGAREVPLTDAMRAMIPADCAMPDELAAEMEGQAAEQRQEARRHERRHRPS